jgi:small subunit ribosomal protein S1
MTHEDLQDFACDEAYWESLLRDVETRAPEPAGDHFRTPVAAPRLDAAAAAWTAAQRASENDEVIQVQSVGSNRGGLLVEWNGLRGFLPASHIYGLAAHLDDEGRRREIAQRVGHTFSAKVIEIDRGQSRFVVSERLAFTQRDRRAALFAELESGQVRSGVITRVCSFGAFVDLGGVEGLLHISEISWGRVNHPGDCLKVGQSVRALVMSVDRETERVALSIKRLCPDPWMTVTARYSIGQIVQCVVTSVVAFGAFARLEDGLEGLIHVSELAEGNFLHPRNVVCEGQTVRVRVLNVDAAHRRLGLSLRRVDGEFVEQAT